MSSPWWKDPDNPRAQIVIRMMREQQEQTVIAQEIGIAHRQQMSVTIKLMKDWYGEKVFLPTQRYRTLTQVAAELHTCRSNLQRLCHEHGIPIIKRKRGSLAVTLFDDGSFRQVEEVLHCRRTKQCVICGRPSPPHFKVCSRRRCQKERRRRRAREYRTKPPTIKTLCCWHQRLLRRLRGHRLWRKERWLRIGKAAKVCSLGQTQINVLRYRQLVKYRKVKDPSSRWETVTEFPLSQLLIAARLYAAHKRSQSS